MRLLSQAAAASTTAALLLVMILGCSSILMVQSCSRVLDNKNPIVVAGRSMEWNESFQDYLYIVPQGMTMDGGAANISMQWNSTYGSVVSSIFGFVEAKGSSSCSSSLNNIKDGGTDGINEKGLGVHVLYLDTTITTYADPTASNTQNAITYLRWARYLLDNFATVAEAVQGMQQIRVVSVDFCGQVLSVEVAIEDATGDSAVFQIVNGQVQIYHGSSNTTVVVTDGPPEDQQPFFLRDYSPWGGSMALPEHLPKGVTANDRFIRLSYYLEALPEPLPADNEVAVIAHIHYLMNSAIVHFSQTHFGIGETVDPTWWTSYSDVTDLVYYFNWIGSDNITHNIIWVDLKSLDFSPGNSVLQLDPKVSTLVGEVSGDFTAVASSSSSSGAIASSSSSSNIRSSSGVSASQIGSTATASPTSPGGGGFSRAGLVAVLVILAIFVCGIGFIVLTDLKHGM